jgi:hypothetical protein
MSRPPQTTHHNTTAPAEAPAAPAQQAAPGTFAMILNPNIPPPIVLSSNLAPPPVHPVPLTNQVVLPVVPPGFPAGPFS